MIFIAATTPIAKLDLVLKRPVEVKIFLFARRWVSGAMIGLQSLKQPAMDIVKTAVGHDQKDISSAGFTQKKIDNGVGIRKVHRRLATGF